MDIFLVILALVSWQFYLYSISEYFLLKIGPFKRKFENFRYRYPAGCKTFIVRLSVSCWTISRLKMSYSPDSGVTSIEVSTVVFLLRIYQTVDVLVNLIQQLYIRLPSMLLSKSLQGFSDHATSVAHVGTNVHSAVNKRFC